MQCVKSTLTSKTEDLYTERIFLPAPFKTYASVLSYATPILVVKLQPKGLDDGGEIGLIVI